MTDPAVARGYRMLAGAAVLGGLGVAAGAFGAHALEGMVPPGRVETFRTAVLYHLVHTLALLVVGVLALRTGSADTRWAARAFAAGIALFSGSLYALVLLDAPALAMITPIGGTLFIAGWGLLAWSAWRAAAGAV